MRTPLRLAAAASALAAMCVLGGTPPGQAAETPAEAEIEHEFPEAVSIRVPEIVRRDLVAKAIDFCLGLCPDTPRGEMEGRLAKYLEAEVWDIEPLASYGPFVRFKGPVEVKLSFPDAMPWQSVLNRSKRLLIPSRKEGEAPSLEWAHRQAEVAFRRLIPDAERRKAFTLDRKRKIHNEYNIRWTAPVGPGHLHDYSSLHVRYEVATGSITSVWLQQVLRGPSDTPVVRREEIEEKAWKIGKKVRRQRSAPKPEEVYLFMLHYMGHRYLCWEYRAPAKPEGAWGITTWDAKTGELVRSNELDAQGEQLYRRKWYRNPKYFPYQTVDQIRRRLEEITQERASELESQRKESNKAGPSTP
ncbi:MAG: hypothetical protein WBD75_04625 [Phycisphaerae bacterium]